MMNQDIIAKRNDHFPHHKTSLLYDIGEVSNINVSSVHATSNVSHQCYFKKKNVSHQCSHIQIKSPFANHLHVKTNVQNKETLTKLVLKMRSMRSTKCRCSMERGEGGIRAHLAT